MLWTMLSVRRCTPSSGNKHKMNIKFLNLFKSSISDVWTDRGYGWDAMMEWLAVCHRAHIQGIHLGVVNLP